MIKGPCGLPPPCPLTRPIHSLGAQKCLLPGAQEHEAAEGRFLISFVLRANLLASGQQARPGPQKKAAIRIVVPVEQSQREGEMLFARGALEIPRIFWPLSLGIEMEIHVGLRGELPVSPLHSKGSS